jgi:hypothetical protein
MLVLCSTALAAAGDAQFRASDDFVLTGAQEDLIWQRMGREIPNDDDGAPVWMQADPILGGAFPGGASRFAGSRHRADPDAQTLQIHEAGQAAVHPDDRRIVDIISPWKIVDVVHP